MSKSIDPQNFLNFDYNNFNNQNTGFTINHFNNMQTGPIMTNTGQMTHLGPLTNYANGFGGGSTTSTNTAETTGSVMQGSDTNSTNESTSQTVATTNQTASTEQNTDMYQNEFEKPVYEYADNDGYSKYYGTNSNGNFSIGEDGSLTFTLPDYGYDKYVMDIANWQKQRISFGAEPGYYYFKVFFNFQTNYGLLGGLMFTINSFENGPYANILASTNTAYGYLRTIKKYHQYENAAERILALAKFAATLKDISLRTPWVFKSLSGLNTINSSYVNNFDKEKTIIIGLGQESVDSRIGTLIDLYKYACFDQINCKEIIPANLRKFEMSIMVYHMPLSQYHNRAMTDKENSQKKGFWPSLGRMVTGKNSYDAQRNGLLPSIWRSINGQDANQMTNLHFDGDVKAKTTNNEADFSNMMSFKLFTFLNCEIDVENSNEYYLDGMSNESAFQLGNNQLKIKYDRVYEHRMNEWAQMFFGSDGFYYNRNIPEIFKGKIKLNKTTTEYFNDGEYYDEQGNPVLPENVIESNLGNDMSFINFNIVPGSMKPDAVNEHEQRINALQKKWIGNMPSGKISIMDYQKLLLGRYYAPVDTPIPHLFAAEPFNLNEMANLNNNYSNWRNEDSKKQWFNNIFRR